MLYDTHFSLSLLDGALSPAKRDCFLFKSRQHNLFIIQETLLCTYYVLDAKRMKLFLFSKTKIVTSVNLPTIFTK